jgi:pimeloyl-ACP methyl ester carboxylesterase
MRSVRISTRRALQGLVAAGSAVLLTAGVTSGAVHAQGTRDRTAPTEPPVAAATWKPCPFPGSPAELECATVAVPIDYADPDGAMTSVTVDRLKARKPAERVGNLYFNPGGPGGSGSGIVYFESMGAELFTAAVRDRFDLIGLDPRGVGLSNALQCDPAVVNRRVTFFPQTEAQFRRLVARNRDLATSCEQLSGPLARHIDTKSAARDIDRVRRALGDDRINYLGLSYGVQLGTQYAELFPSHIRTMALDGVLVHSLSPVQLFADEAGSYEATLNRFFSWCGRDASCALHGRNVARLFDRLVARADRTPIPARGCTDGHCRRTVTGEDIRFHAEELLLFKEPIPLVAPEGWNALALALRAAAAGDATALSTPLARSRADDGASGAPLAIECLDWPNLVRSLSDVKRLQLLGETVAPHGGGASQAWTFLVGCVGRTAPVVNPPHPTRVTGTPRLLLVNSTHDPSTPYVWAQQLASEVRRSVLLTRKGDGHTSYLVHGPSRTRDAIDGYLVTGRTPPPNTVFHN